jgi:hypothetical protein
MSGDGNAATWSGTGEHYAADAERQGVVQQYNGTDDHLTLVSPITVSGDFTLAAWVWCATYESPFYPTILGFNESANALRIERVTGQVVCRISDASRVCTQSGIAASAWAHVAVSRAGSTLAGYINGIDDTPDPAPTIGNPFPVTWIGRTHQGGSPLRYWDGLLDDLRVYRRCLPAAEIWRIFDRGRVAPLSDLAEPVGWEVGSVAAARTPLPLINGGLINAGLIGGGLIR